jgi:capsular exopolysaccharide synthesis family protein
MGSESPESPVQVAFLPNRAPDQRQAVGSIAYTQTRVIRSDKEFLREKRIIAGMEPGPVTDAYKILCIQVLQRLREKKGNSLAVVSPGIGEGKTLTAINLAFSLALEVDQTVLLVDANLRQPSIHRYFGFVPEAGLSDHLLSNTPLDEILVNPGVERFVLLPGGRPLPNSSEMLGSMKMERLVQELKHRYPSRIVIFDLPPVLSMADVVAFSPYVDGALMVAQENKTRREEMQRAAEMLRSVDLIGTVLNRAAEAQPKPATSHRPVLNRLFGRKG